jgi:hypothetical protein
MRTPASLLLLLPPACCCCGGMAAASSWGGRWVLGVEDGIQTMLLLLL